MRRPVALAVAVAVVLGLGVLADRAVQQWAEEKVAQQLAAQTELAGPPDVDVRGFPFLTQALDGRYDDVRISLDPAELGPPGGVTADVRLTGVRLPLSSVLAGQVREVPVDRVEGTATLSYPLLAGQFGAGSVLSRDGDAVRITGTVQLRGQTVPLEASGTIRLDGTALVVDVHDVSGHGQAVPGFIVEEAGDLLDLRYEVPPLPFGLRLTGVAPGDDGVVVQVEATDVVLAPR